MKWAKHLADTRATHLKWVYPEVPNHRMFGVGRDLCGYVRGWKGPLWFIKSNRPCQSRVTYSRMHRTLSWRVLNISREGDSTAPLGSLFQCSVTLRGKKFFLMFRRNFLWPSLCPLPLVLSLDTTEKSLAPSSWHPPFRFVKDVF